MAQLQNIIRSNAGAKPSKRCRRNKTRAISSGTGLNAPHDFLKQTFTPLLRSKLFAAQNATLTEKSFFTSVTNLCKAYRIERPMALGLPFPINLLATFQQLKSSIESVNKHTTLFISGSPKKPVIGVARTIAMPYDLYYIPLYFIAYLLSQPEHRAIAHLIVSACSRLHYHGVSLCDHSSFIFYEMEMIAENLQQNAWDGDRQEYEHEIRTANFIISSCQKLTRAIAKGKTHYALQRRLTKIIAHTPWEEKMIAVIKKINVLQEKYPKRSFNDQIPKDWNINNNDDVIYPDQYLTFYWGGQSAFDDNLSEWIDSYLQESTNALYPTFFQIYDREQTIIENPFGFESELLTLITEFNQLLYDYRPY